MAAVEGARGDRRSDATKPKELGPGFSLPAEKFRNFRNLPSTGGARYFASTVQNFRHFETVRAKNWALMLCEPAKQLEHNKKPFLTHYGAAGCILDCALILYNIWHYGGLLIFRTGLFI